MTINCLKPETKYLLSIYSKTLALEDSVHSGSAIILVKC